MLNWLVRMWQRIGGSVHRWIHGNKIPESYHRSNLHGRHR
jgi:hypothetical protein